MEYIGENLLPGQWGHLFVVASFVAGLLSFISFFLATKNRQIADQRSWLNLGRFAFALHGLATFGVIATLFVILTGKMYEYQYAWANVSDDLPTRYVFSAFWKEQQGSFLLWSFWHIILSVVLMWRAGKWEAPVMTVVALAETFIASMLLGIYFNEFRFGASPFDLLRDIMDAPIFSQANYLEKIKGNGLNPLLQNYWMTIHPPTLFLGFASTIVPFAFAVAGMWLREHRDWLRPALGWALFSAAILGTGILMGGVWAYEALSFAGYWAWDPVENASLVPWLIMLAGIHTNLVARSTGYSIRSTYGFYLASFLLILYSTYLTRSGVLGDSSVHSFTEMGLGFQLVMFMTVFTLGAIAMFAMAYKQVPDVVVAVDQKINFVAGQDGVGRAEMHTEINQKTEESINSREFWMFIGALVLLFSSVLITVATSLPVFNKLLGTDWALKDPVEHHNRYQLWIAVFMGLLTGVAQFMRYNERNWPLYRKKFMTHIAVAILGAALLTLFNKTWIDVNAWQLYAFLFAGMFAVVANADYIVSVLRGNLRLAGSAVSHLGFGLLLLGILSTGLGKTWISSNRFAMEGLVEGMDAERLGKNVTLLKEAPMPIKGNLTATYLSDTIERQIRTFKVTFERRDTAGNPTGEQFTLYPNVMYDRNFEKIVASNPSTQHYWDHDIFTHVSSLPKSELEPEYARQMEDSIKWADYEALVGDTLFLDKQWLVVDEVTKTPVHPDYKPEKGDLAIGLKMRAYEKGSDRMYPMVPMLYFRPGQGAFSVSHMIGQLRLKIRLTEATMAQAFKAEDGLKYQEFGVKEGGTFDYKGYKIRFAQVVKDIKHPLYTPEANDVAVGAGLEITASDGRVEKAIPVYLIRNNQQLTLKDEAASLGLHFRFERIDPQAGILYIGVAESTPEMRRLPLQIATNVERSDFIVLEAIVFPGINLVWIGSIMMLFGLVMAYFRRLFAQ
jgi:cytochrome c-type biogenesis protein CcmF